MKDYEKKGTVAVEVWVTDSRKSFVQAAYAFSIAPSKTHPWRASICFAGRHNLWERFKTKAQAVAWCENWLK